VNRDVKKSGDEPEPGGSQYVAAYCYRLASYCQGGKRGSPDFLTCNSPAVLDAKAIAIAHNGRSVPPFARASPAFSYEGMKLHL